jgi:hypothetical protein
MARGVAHVQLRCVAFVHLRPAVSSDRTPRFNLLALRE